MSCEDVKSSTKVKNINFGLIRSLILNKDFTSLDVKEVIILRDEFNYELNFLIFLDKAKWNDFFKHISESNVTFKLKKTAMMESNRLLIYDKYENFYKEHFNRILFKLRWYVVDYFTKILDYQKNFLLKFEDLSKIVLVCVNNKKMTFDNTVLELPTFPL